MAKQNTDLRKLFVKVKLKNTLSGCRAKGDSSFNTTDIAYISSYSEQCNVKEKKRVKSISDFAISNCAVQMGSTFARNYELGGPYWLRSANDASQVVAISNEGTFYTWPIDDVGISTAVSLNFNVDTLLSAKDSSNFLKITSTQDDSTNLSQYVGEERHYVELGEYPGQIAEPMLQLTLENLFNNGHLKKGLTCTGKLYTTNGQRGYCEDFLSKQNPEFEYNGERYVRVITWSKQSNKGYNSGFPLTKEPQVIWHKVEPVKLEITNWDKLPTSINPKGKIIGGDKIVRTMSERSLFAGIPFYPDRDDANSSMWQNSLLRAYLNSAKSSELDGNPKFKAPRQWDFTKSGFIYQAFDMTREPTKEYTIPASENEVADYAFEGCVGISKVIIPSHVTEIGERAFAHCRNTQIVFENINDNFKFGDDALESTSFKFIYLSNDGKNIILSPYSNAELEKTCIRRDYVFHNIKNIFNKNYRENLLNTQNWKQSGKIKFIPPEYTIATFPSTEMEKYFINNNNQRWAKLVKTLGFDTLEGREKNNSLTDLMKIYYAIGGFSENQGESERAYEYILNYVAVTDEANPTPKQIGDEIHSRFSKLQLKGPFNPEFAKFFMKYYKDDHNFMVFWGRNRFELQDYLCIAHNSFAEIQKAFPNRVVNGNEERSLLTPQFVAEHSMLIKYEDVDEGNEALANLIGKYGYTQEEFGYIQNIYNKAKTLKDKYVISADRADEENGISFRVLEKDDPLGFVLGDITNCCQHIGGAGGECVDDGYLNPEAGFLVFEETILDENGEPTGDKRILGQAYIWYDPETKTVCYDNIEIPTKILNELEKGDKHNGRLSSAHLLDAVVKSAEMIMLAMNKKGIKVERVTTGKGYNDLATDLEKRFGEPERNPKAKHRSYYGYSDARYAQYIIKDLGDYKRGRTSKKIRSKDTEESHLELL